MLSELSVFTIVFVFRSKYEVLLSTWKSPLFVPDHSFLKHERVIGEQSTQFKQLESHQINLSQVKSTWVKSNQLESSQINSTQRTWVTSNQLESSQINSSQINLSQINSSQINLSQINSSQIKLSQINSSQINSSQINLSQVKSTRVKSTRVKSTRVSRLFEKLYTLCLTFNHTDTEKDCLRTDRHLEFYSEGNENTDKLRRILTTFVIHDPELGKLSHRLVNATLNLCCNNAGRCHENLSNRSMGSYKHSVFLLSV